MCSEEISSFLSVALGGSQSLEFARCRAIFISAIDRALLRAQTPLQDTDVFDVQVLYVSNPPRLTAGL